MRCQVADSWRGQEPGSNRAHLQQRKLCIAPARKIAAGPVHVALHICMQMLAKRRVGSPRSVL